MEIQGSVTEYYKQLYPTTGQPSRNGQIPRNIQSSKTEPRRNRKR